MYKHSALNAQGKHAYINTYRFVSEVPLRDGDDALMVNWCELAYTRDNGKITYKNAFATNHAISGTNTFTAGLTIDIENLPHAYQFLPLMGFGRHASVQRKPSYISRHITELFVQIASQQGL